MDFSLFAILLPLPLGDPEDNIFSGCLFFPTPAAPFCHITSLQSLNPYCVILREFYLSRVDASHPAAQSVMLFYTISFLFLFLSL